MSTPPPSDELTQSTIAYYDEHAEDYCESTVALDMEALYRPFLELLPEGARILDAGCGSGRDSLYFQGLGYNVTTFDASEEMVRLSSRLLGRRTLKMRFQELAFEEEFDGVWACASLLHVNRGEMKEVLQRLARSLVLQPHLGI